MSAAPIHLFPPGLLRRVSEQVELPGMVGVTGVDSDHGKWHVLRHV